MKLLIMKQVYNITYICFVTKLALHKCKRPT